MMTCGIKIQCAVCVMDALQIAQRSGFALSEGEYAKEVILIGLFREIEERENSSMRLQ